MESSEEGGEVGYEQEGDGQAERMIGIASEDPGESDGTLRGKEENIVSDVPLFRDEHRF